MNLGLRWIRRERRELCCVDQFAVLELGMSKLKAGEPHMENVGLILSSMGIAFREFAGATDPPSPNPGQASSTSSFHHHPLSCSRTAILFVSRHLPVVCSSVGHLRKPKTSKKSSFRIASTSTMSERKVLQVGQDEPNSR